jgi:hydroxypyruvate reductase
VNAKTGEGRRRLLLELFRAGLASVEGRSCVRRTLREQPQRSGRPVWVAAVGKAACSMALGAQDALGESLGRVLLITKDGHVTPECAHLPRAEVLESAHPVPDSRSLAAGERLLRWVGELPADVDPLFLISGGASSLVEVLDAGVTLADLSRLTSEGLAQGLSIGELNARRARVSRLKGGKLTARLGSRAARALFISDVPGDDPDLIGSGLLGRADTTGDAVERRIVASVDQATEAVRAAAADMGLAAARAARRFDGDAVRLAVRFAHELHFDATPVHIWGGESTVQLPKDPGRGGRNQHLALAAAKLIAGQGNIALLAAGTDGTDGPTDDAGALVDAETLARVSLAGLDAEQSLARADANTALAAAGDLIHTGPTGTNVGDLVIGLNLPLDGAESALQRRDGVRGGVL